MTVSERTNGSGMAETDDFGERRLTTGEMLAAEWRVLFGLILRDIKTRFGGSIWGYLISLGWPLSHILIILLINLAMGRLPPYGDSAAIWFSTGIVPFMAFSYMSRFIMMAISTNRPLLICSDIADRLMPFHSATIPRGIMANAGSLLRASR